MSPKQKNGSSEPDTSDSGNPLPTVPDETSPVTDRNRDGVSDGVDSEAAQHAAVAGEISPADIANNSLLVFEELRGINSELRREIDTSSPGMSGDRIRHWQGRFSALESMFGEALGPIVPKDGTGVPDWAKKGPPYVIPDPSLQLGTANETPGNPARPVRAQMIEEANTDKNG